MAATLIKDYLIAQADFGFLRCTIIAGPCGYLAALHQRGVWLKKGSEAGPGGKLGSKSVGNFLVIHYRWGYTEETSARTWRWKSLRCLRLASDIFNFQFDCMLASHQTTINTGKGSLDDSFRLLSLAMCGFGRHKEVNTMGLSAAMSRVSTAMLKCSLVTTVVAPVKVAASNREKHIATPRLLLLLEELMNSLRTFSWTMTCSHVPPKR